jgi:F-type H+-transporting ATPase subunit epsilon
MATAEVHGDEVGAKKDGKGAAAGRIRCLVVTPERTTLDEPVDFAAIPLYDGELGILPGHTPLIGRLGYGTLRVKSGGAERRYFVDGGFAQLRDDVLTVLTQRAIPADQLDASAAAGELDKARSMVATTDLQREEKERAIARARAQLRTAESAT